MRNLVELERWAASDHEVPLEPDLPIVDAHHHLWESDVGGTFLVRESGSPCRSPRTSSACCGHSLRRT